VEKRKETKGKRFDLLDRKGGGTVNSSKGKDAAEGEGTDPVKKKQDTVKRGKSLLLFLLLRKRALSLNTKI